MQTENGALPLGNGEAGWLVTGPIGGAPQKVAQFGSFGGQSGPEVLACSYLNDQAVVGEFAIWGYAEVSVIKLSTGAVLFHHLYPTHPINIHASHDSRYLAEVTDSGTTIRRTSDGRIMAQLPNVAVVGFSWDGNRVITLPVVGTSGEAQLLDWQTGRVIWRLPVGADVAQFAPVSFLAQPGGGDVLLSIGRPNVYGQTDDLWLIQADGTAKKLVSGPINAGW
jgi:hypothetical protein